MSSLKFILSSVIGRKTLNDDPIGWDSVKKVFSRHLDYMGVFRKRTANLKFVGDGLQYLSDLDKLGGTEAVCNITVLRKKDYEDAWELDFEGVAKLNPFDLEWEDDLSPTVSVEFEDSGFHAKFIARTATEVNIGQELSIEGTNVGPMPTKDIKIGQRVVQENCVFKLSQNTSYCSRVVEPEPFITSRLGHVLPLEEVVNDSEIIAAPIDYAIHPEVNISGLMCEFLLQPLAVQLKYHIAGSANSPGTDGAQADYVRWVLRVFTDAADMTIFTDTLLHESTIVLHDGTSFDFDFSGSLSFHLEKDQAFTLLCYFEPVDSSNPRYVVVYTLCDVTSPVIQNFEEYISKCHYRYEFTKRLVQIITDRLDCFKSDAFGRISLGYLQDGIWHNNVLMNGKQIRGFNEFPVWSFQKTFKSARAIWNVGCGIERIDNLYKVVIEDITYFFRGTISVTLHNVRRVRRKVADDFTFSEVKVGYDKAEYLEVNGLEEYNNKSSFATFIKSDTNTLDLISNERADGYGMEFARRKSTKVAGSEDTQYDSDVFTAMVYEDTEGLLHTQRDENYDSVDNIQSPESAINLDITPQRNLFRNGDWIKACVNKYPDEKLKFVSADRPTDLVSKRTTSPTVVAEQTDILNKDLKSSLWLNLNYIFESDIVPSEISTIELKPNSLIKFSPFSREQTKKYYYGWIMEITVGGKERQGTFVLLAANIASDRLKIVDPDGVYDRFPETPLPPTVEEVEMGFEYVFEKVFES